jgi:hypothetical protein
VTNTPELVFSGLHLPRPLETEAVARFLGRLAADRAAPRVVLELRADPAGVRHLLGCRPIDVHGLRQLLGDLIPGSVLTTPTQGTQPPRPSVKQVGHLRLRPAELPLRTDTHEATTRALLSAIATRLRTDETIVVQIVLGPRQAPRSVPAKIPPPDAGLLRALIDGNHPASPETRTRIKERVSHGGFAAIIRLGAASPDRARQRRFIVTLLSAISTAQSPGVRIDLIHQPAAALNDVRLPWRWPLRLGVNELVGLLGFPIGSDELPGLPPAHPKSLRAGSNVHTGPRVFATSAAPGDERLIGIAPNDQTFHGIAYGPSGSGKTNALLHLIIADIHAGRPVAVLDPKRQLIDDIVSRVPDHRLNDVVVLDASDDVPVGFNPLDVAGRDPDVVVDGILSVFEAVFSDGWGPRTPTSSWPACAPSPGPAPQNSRPRCSTSLGYSLIRSFGVSRSDASVPMSAWRASGPGSTPSRQRRRLRPSPHRSTSSVNCSRGQRLSKCSISARASFDSAIRSAKTRLCSYRLTRDLLAQAQRHCWVHS